ncbi:MAG: LPS-assembly protein LptD [Candidatus Cloacimonetes bacterium]|nr:LPS-assembly protein LptD [Candidatus Cloacimonadota bacterium]
MRYTDHTLQRYIVICALVFLALSGLRRLESQTPAPNGTGGDSLSVVADSLAIPTQQDSLFYQADYIRFDYAAEQIHLQGNTKVQYQSSTIDSDSLRIDLQRDRAFSYGPTVMIDGDQILIGRDVRFDIRSQTGMMTDGSSLIEKGYYFGDEIRKVDTDIYDVDGGRFTTCDDLEPHFWFWSGRMRIYRNDKVVGKPVIVYVNEFPVFYFPFVTFSIKRGRQAGLLLPEPGYNNVDGKFVRNIAWYYPYNEFADLILAMDLMEKTGWKTRLQTAYVKRYEFNGNLNAAYQKGISGGTTYYDWSLRGNHHHELPERASFDVNLDFISNKRIWQGSDTIDESLAQQLTSSISYRKPLMSSYFSAGANYTQDLVNDRAVVTLPSASFSLPTRPGYELFKVDSDRATDAWWSNFTYNYSVRLAHTGDIRDPDRSFTDIFWDNTLDPADTTGVTYLNEHHAGIRNELGLSYRYKYRGWLNLSQSVSYNEAWFDRDRDGNNWVRGSDYGMTAGMSFNLYGIRNFRSAPVASVRHILTPSASLRWSPDLRDNSRFFSFGGISVASGKESVNLTLSLDQKWQVKLTGQSADRQRRLDDIIGIRSSVNADLLKDKRQFGTISHSAYFRPGAYQYQGVRFDYSATAGAAQDPYRVRGNDLHLRNLYFSQRVSFGGNAPYTEYFPREKNTLFNNYLPPDTLQARADMISATQTKTENWSLALAHDLYAEKDIFRSRSSNLRMNANLKLTTNWTLGYSNTFDLKQGEMITQSYNISRQLHGWRLDISYSRRNEFWEYRIAFFNLVLPDALRFQTRDSKRY